MNEKSVTVAVEKYLVTGTGAGYVIETLDHVSVHHHVDGAAKCQRLAGTGGSDPLTNTQRGVIWLKNQRMARETAVATVQP